MAILPIRLFPDPVLRIRSKPADWRDPAIQKLIKNLTETLYAQPGGIGIAAPQVGEPKRVIVIDVSRKDPSKGRIIMINPTLLRAEGETLTREGCMSLPDYTGSVRRASRVGVQWTDEEGRKRKAVLKGLEAVCLQHEMDHLDGFLFVDRVASLRTEVFIRAGKRRKQ